MVTILLIIIYLSFISLGLPDALLGSAWPSMYEGLQVPMSYAGVISMLIAGGTIVSSLQSNRLIKKLGTGKVTAISVGITATALFGFSISHSFLALCIWAIPYGLGAGSVDAALNNFVALHYKARHMSWLHCFWGVGATFGPYIMGFCLTGGMRWNSGYRIVFVIQMLLTVVLICTIPLWKKSSDRIQDAHKSHKNLRVKELIQIPGAFFALLAFFAYCSLEATTGLWGSIYMVKGRGISNEMAATWTSLFYLGITLGRFLSGFITMKLGDKKMIRLGQGIAVSGVLLLLLPAGDMILCIGFVSIGLGCAPIFPSLLHATPVHFGEELSQAIMGIQMACAYVGSTFMPPLVGLAVEHIHMKLYPLFLSALLLLMIIMVEKLNKKAKQHIVN
ncbi:MAG: MFS transporter [Lachnospiraceae bacterium]